MIGVSHAHLHARVVSMTSQVSHQPRAATYRPTKTAMNFAWENILGYRQACTLFYSPEFQI